MSKALDYAHRAAASWIDGLDERPVTSRATLQELAAAFRGPLPETGSRPEEVIAWLTEKAADGMLGRGIGRGERPWRMRREEGGSRPGRQGVSMASHRPWRIRREC